MHLKTICAKLIQITGEMCGAFDAMLLRTVSNYNILNRIVVYHVSQVLQGKWASSYMPSSFGYSMTGNTDIDQNGYPGKQTHAHTCTVCVDTAGV